MGRANGRVQAGGRGVKNWFRLKAEVCAVTAGEGEDLPVAVPEQEPLAIADSRQVVQHHGWIGLAVKQHWLPGNTVVRGIGSPMAVEAWRGNVQYGQDFMPPTRHVPQRTVSPVFAGQSGVDTVGMEGEPGLVQPVAVRAAGAKQCQRCHNGSQSHS